MITKVKQAPASRTARRHGPLRMSEYRQSEIMVLPDLEAIQPEVREMISEVGFIVLNPIDHEDIRSRILAFVDFIQKHGVNLIV